MTPERMSLIIIGGHRENSWERHLGTNSALETKPPGMKSYSISEMTCSINLNKPCSPMAWAFLHPEGCLFSPPCSSHSRRAWGLGHESPPAFWGAVLQGISLGVWEVGRWLLNGFLRRAFYTAFLFNGNYLMHHWLISKINCSSFIPPKLGV